MNKIELSEDFKRSEYLFFILNALNMNVDEFMISITYPERCYERTIYRWIIKLIDKGKSKELALQIIFKARILYFIRNTQVRSEQSQNASNNLIDLLQMLDSNANYKKLSDNEKLIVQQKIDEPIGIASSKQIIEQVLEKMNPVVEAKKETKVLEKFAYTLKRIRKGILQLNIRNHTRK